jgi:hypothetical protein
MAEKKLSVKAGSVTLDQRVETAWAKITTVPTKRAGERMTQRKCRKKAEEALPMDTN